VTPPIGTVSVERHWGTHVVIDHIDLTGIAVPGLAAPGPSGPSIEHVDPAGVLADEAALRAALLTSMAAVSAGQGFPLPTGLTMDIQAWRGGYDLPATSYGADVIAWCFLAAVDPQHEESGAIALADPRAGSALTAMPGLPWGRQIMIRPTAGAHAAAPGWLTCSVVPVEKGQSALVAVATSIR